MVASISTTIWPMRQIRVWDMGVLWGFIVFIRPSGNSRYSPARTAFIRQLHYLVNNGTCLPKPQGTTFAPRRFGFERTKSPTDGVIATAWRKHDNRRRSEERRVGKEGGSREWR